MLFFFSEWCFFCIVLIFFFKNFVSNVYSFKVLFLFFKEVNLLMVICNNVIREMSICDMSICGKFCF